MKIDIRKLEAPIAGLEKRWEAVPGLLKRLAMPVGFVGLLLLIGDLLLWIARGRLFDLWGSLAFAGGLVLMLGGIGLNTPGFLRAALEFAGPRRALYGTNALVVVALAFVVLTFANYFASRYYVRWDLSPDNIYTLHERTANLLKKIDEDADEKGDLEIHYFYDPGPLPYSNFYLSREMQNLLAEYAAKSDHVKLHLYSATNIADQERLKAALARLKIDPSAVPLDWVLITYNNEKQRKDLKRTDLVEQAPPMYGPPPEPKFKGEDAISTAIRDLLQSESVVCYFMTGHGERDTGNTQGSMVVLLENLRGLNMTVKTLDFVATPIIPTDARVIVIADPREPAFRPVEIDKLRAFVEDSMGSVIVMAEPYTLRKQGRSSGIGEFLSRYGIRLRDDLVTVQMQAVLGGMTLRPQILANQYMPPHPATAPLEKAHQPVYFDYACALQAGQAMDERYAAVALVRAPETIGAMNTEDVEQAQRNMLQGPIVLAAVSEPKNPDAKLGRVAAFADTDFVALGPDIAQKGPGLNLVTNVISHFAGKKENLGIEERKPTRRFINFSPTAQRVLYFGVVLALPILVIFSGIFILLIRRR
ncbi:MAG: GldG family protein [Planctomycetes bacterium]|nr:GldG family protein [Planctomycetota bacterium]